MSRVIGCSAILYKIRGRVNIRLEKLHRRFNIANLLSQTGSEIPAYFDTDIPDQAMSLLYYYGIVTLQKSFNSLSYERDVILKVPNEFVYNDAVDYDFADKFDSSQKLLSSLLSSPSVDTLGPLLNKLIGETSGISYSNKVSESFLSLVLKPQFDSLLVSSNFKFEFKLCKTEGRIDLVMNEHNSSILIRFMQCRYSQFPRLNYTLNWLPETFMDCDKLIESASEVELMDWKYQANNEIITLEEYFARALKQLDAHRLLYKSQNREEHSVTCFVAIQIGRRIVVKELTAGV
jgi:hypothetical protein